MRFELIYWQCYGHCLERIVLESLSDLTDKTPFLPRTARIALIQAVGCPSHSTFKYRNESLLYPRLAKSSLSEIPETNDHTNIVTPMFSMAMTNFFLFCFCEVGQQDQLFLVKIVHQTHLDQFSN